MKRIIPRGRNKVFNCVETLLLIMTFYSSKSECFDRGAARITLLNKKRKSMGEGKEVGERSAGHL